MSAGPSLRMTFEEYLKIPDPPGYRCELHHGELVKVPFPLHGHFRTQAELRKLLERNAGEGFIVTTVLPFKPAPEYECWRADVACLSKARWDAIKDYLSGAPDLVVEVLSEWDTAQAVFDKRRLCLETGSREFWVVDVDLREVDVSTADGHGTPTNPGRRFRFSSVAGWQWTRFFIMRQHRPMSRNDAQFMQDDLDEENDQED